jgi:hypothetical protein
MPDRWQYACVRPSLSRSASCEGECGREGVVVVAVRVKDVEEESYSEVRRILIVARQDSAGLVAVGIGGKWF